MTLIGTFDIVVPLCFFYCVASSDACAPLSKASFIKWLEKGLNIDLSAAVTVEDLGRALGLWSEEEQQQQLEQEQPGQELDGVEPAEKEDTADSPQSAGEYCAEEEATIGTRDDDKTGAGTEAVTGHT